MRKKRRGFSLVELMFASMFATVIVTGAMVMTVGVGRSYNRTSFQYEVDQNASRGIQRMTDDFQEAKQFQIISSSRVRIFYPVSSGGSYNRKITDLVNTIDYYRGTEDGTESASGTFLIRAAVNQSTRPVADNVSRLEFTSESPSSVAVDFRCSKTVGDKTFNCAMNHRAILMRNYSQ